jgi:hypothetical protein
MPQDKFLIVKREDISKYLTIRQQIELDKILATINSSRTLAGKKQNFYAVINTDELYFPIIQNIMEKNGHWEE